MHDRRQAPGQLRVRPLSQTLAAACEASRDAGVTRLADLSAMAPLGVAVFQAVRPLGRLFSVSQGKGLSPAAAKVSALLEAIETDLAERLAPEGERKSLADLDAAAVDLWHAAPRGTQAIRVDPAVRRHWAMGRDLASGRTMPVPWDLLCLDLARDLPRDVQPSSLGLATGNSETEALVGAVAELLEHDLDLAADTGGPFALRRCELDLGSVTDPIAATLIGRLRARSVALRVWSLGQEVGLPAFRCALSDADWQSSTPPVVGNGCHPDRQIALIRAILEAVQTRCMMVAGAREDLSVADYANGARRNGDLIMSSLSFGPGPLAWADVHGHAVDDVNQALDILLAAAGRRTSLPIVAFSHRQPHRHLWVAHCIGPGLQEARREGGQAPPPRIASIAASIVVGRRPVLFVGPTLASTEVPAGFDVRPPAICGDLAALLVDPPPAVALIDGCFEAAPSVWHKEILALMALGTTVIGGASLGAIRAAELEPFGMIGVGAVFAAYRDGRVCRDDAVMVCHAPAALGSRPFTLSLVDAEHALDQAELPPAVLRQLRRIVRTVDFRERSWAHCLEAYRRRTGTHAPVDAATLEARSDLKRRDALAVVARLAAAGPGVRRALPPITGHFALLLANRVPALRADHP